MSSENVFRIPLFKSYSYEELKSQQLALGLDLKGGLSALLQVDVKSLLENLSRNSNDGTLRQALNNAEDVMMQQGTDFITAFGNEWSKLANGKDLASIFARNEVLAEDIDFNSSDNTVISVLRKKADETVDLTYRRLKDRIDKFGVVQPNISLDESRGAIMVELPGVEHYERARNYLQAQANLEFWNVYRITGNIMFSLSSQRNERLRRIPSADTADLSEEVEQNTKATIVTAVVDTLERPTGDSTTPIGAAPEGEPPFAGGAPFRVFQTNLPGALGLAAMGD